MNTINGFKVSSLRFLISFNGLLKTVRQIQLSADKGDLAIFIGCQFDSRLYLYWCQACQKNILTRPNSKNRDITLIIYHLENLGTDKLEYTRDI